MDTDAVVEEREALEASGLPPGEAEDLAHHPGARQYIVVAVLLAVATGLEVALYYMELPRALLIVLLLFFAVVKFALVILYFMHLRFDNRLFRRLFFTGLILALGVYLIVLLAFEVVEPVPTLIGVAGLAAGAILATSLSGRLRRRK